MPRILRERVGGERVDGEVREDGEQHEDERVEEGASAHEEVVRDEAVVRESAAPEVAVAVFDELDGERGAHVGNVVGADEWEGERA